MAKQTEDVQKILGEPVLADYPEDLQRTKRNLLIVAGITIFVQLSGVQISEANLFVVRLTNLTITSIRMTFLVVLSYFAIQFWWQTIDYLMNSRLRITGTRVRHQTGAMVGSELADYPSDPRQSTLYNWWAEESREIGNMAQTAKAIEEAAARLIEAAARPDAGELPNINHIKHTGAGLRESAGALHRRLEQTEQTISSTRIPASLERFDRWFGCFTASQRLRVWALDVLVPTATAVFGLSLLILSLTS